MTGARGDLAPDTGSGLGAKVEKPKPVLPEYRPTQTPGIEIGPDGKRRTNLPPPKGAP